MAIRFHCASCYTPLRAKAEFVGRVIRCPKCGDSMPIPSLPIEEEPNAGASTNLIDSTPATSSQESKEAALKQESLEPKNDPTSGREQFEEERETAIHFHCASCHTPLRAKTEFVGRVIRCPECGASMSIPSLPIEEEHNAGTSTNIIDSTPATSMQESKEAALKQESLEPKNNPTSGREQLTGVIKIYNENKGFGFIVEPSHPEGIFFHISRFHSRSSSMPQIGEEVIFELTQGQRGLEAKDVRPTQSSDIPSEASKEEGIVTKLIWDEHDGIRFGFITAELDKREIFFHPSSWDGSRVHQGDRVRFSPGKDKEGRERAQFVRRSGERITGDIIEWRVEPTGEGHGKIATHQGQELADFSFSDIDRNRNLNTVRIRPWHAAEFFLVRGESGLTARDVRIDSRYPLQRFANLGDEDEVLRSLKFLTLDENWDYRRSLSKRRFQILHSYLHFTFARLKDEDRFRDTQSKKIRIRTDLRDRRPLAAFNTGLVDKRYESIFALFEGTDSGSRLTWKFLGFCTPGERLGKLLSSYFNPLPGPAQYFDKPSDLLYDPDATLHPDYSHILIDNRNRLPAALLKVVEDMDENAKQFHLKTHLDRAIDVAKKRARWNFKTAIPHYFPSFKRLELLLPLCMVKDGTVDVALAVQKTDTGYLGSTILKLDWAYKSARLVCRPDSDWLAPDQIESVGDTDESASE